MRNMSNIPKLPEQRGAEQLLQRESWCTQQRSERASGHSPHNGRPAPPTLRSLLTASAGGLLPETRAIPGQNRVVWLVGWGGVGGAGGEKKQHKSVSSGQNERAEENAQRRGDENTRTRKSFVARAQTPPSTQNSCAVGDTQQKRSLFITL